MEGAHCYSTEYVEELHLARQRLVAMEEELETANMKIAILTVAQEELRDEVALWRQEAANLRALVDQYQAEQNQNDDDGEEEEEEEEQEEEQAQEQAQEEKMEQ